MKAFKVGDRIALAFDDSPSEVLHAVVCRMLTDREEGLGPEIEDYVAGWLEISVEDCAETASRRSVSFGTDDRYSMDGRTVTITQLEVGP